MAISWGPWETAPSPGGTSGMRVGFEASWSAVTTNSSSATLTIKIWTENWLTYTGDSQTINFGGGIGGSDYNFSNSSGTSPVHRTTRTYTYNYSTWGSSPGFATLTATMSGVFDGTTAGHSATYTIPARPYAAPNAPDTVAGARNSDSQITVTWQRNPTSQRPYTSQTVQMRTITGPGAPWSAWSTVATVSSTATSYVKTGLVANRIYQFQVRANNSVGSSAFVAHATAVYMTPAAPSNVVSNVNSAGTQITTTWKNNAYTSAYNTFTIQRSVNGGAYANVVTGLSQATLTWTDTTPGAGTNTYRISTVSSYATTPDSAFATGNTVTTIVPPLAPTNLSPNGVNVDLSNKPVVLTWKHNPGGDGAAQSAFAIDYSSNGGGAWNTLVGTTTSTASTYTIPAGTLANGTTYLWRVRTRGVTSGGFGPNSASASITGTTTPTVSISAPTATTIALPLVVSWLYNQDELSPQASWEVVLYAANGVDVLQNASGSGTTSSIALSYPVEDGQTYVVEVRAQSALGQWSDWDSVTTTVILPFPALAHVEPEYQPCTGTMLLHLFADDPQPITVWQNEVRNPNFETNLTDWSSVNASATLTRSTVDPISGTASALLSVAVSGVVGLQFLPTTVSSRAQVTGGIPNELSIDVNPSAERIMGLDLSYYDEAGTAVGSYETGPTEVVPGGVTSRLTLVTTPPSGATRVRLIPMVSNAVSGDLLRFDNAYVGRPGGGYFDGDTPDGSTVHSWDGTAHASTSTAVKAAETAVEYVIVERRVNGGNWVTIADNVPLPNDLLDIIPLTNGLNEYRLTAVSSAPSYRLSPEVAAYGTDGQVGSDAVDGLWVFLAYGPGFSNVLRFRSDPQISEGSGRVRSAQPFLGRKKSVLLTGINTNRQVQVKGGLHYESRCLHPTPDDCHFDSPVVDWIEAGQEAELVCYRDYTGRRLFGMLSDVGVDDGLWPGNASVSFSVTEVDHLELGGSVTIIEDEEAPPPE